MSNKNYLLLFLMFFLVFAIKPISATIYDQFNYTYSFTNNDETGVTRYDNITNNWAVQSYSQTDDSVADATALISTLDTNYLQSSSNANAACSASCYNGLATTLVYSNSSTLNLSTMPIVKIFLNQSRLVNEYDNGNPVQGTASLSIKYFGITIYSLTQSYNSGAGAGSLDRIYDRNSTITITKVNNSFWTVDFSGINTTSASVAYNFTSLTGDGISFLTSAQSSTNSPTGKQVDASAYLIIDNVTYEGSALYFTGISNNATPNTIYNSTVNFAANFSSLPSIITNWTFSWNGTGVWANQTYTTNLQQFSVNVTTNQTYGVRVCGLFYAKNIDNIINQSDQSCFTVGNTIPTINSVAIHPTPADSSTPLSCNFTFSDIDTQTFTNQTLWYKNYTLNISLTNQTTIGIGNLTTNDVWLCSKLVYDGINYSSWINSSAITLGDSTPPIFVSASASSVTVGTSTTIVATLYDLLSPILSVTVEVTDPNFVKTNFSMSFVNGTNMPNSNSTWTRSYSVSLQDNHSLRFYFSDTNSNLNSTLSSYTFFSGLAASSGSQTPSGGGGSAASSVQLTNYKGNGICDVGENSFNAPEDCAPVEGIINVLSDYWILSLIIIFFISLLVADYYDKKPKKRGMIG